MNTQDYRRLRLKLSSTILLFSLVPLLALGFIIHDQFKRAYTGKVKGQMQVIVNNKRSSIDMFLDERISQLKTLAQTHTFGELSRQKALEAVFRTVQVNSGSFVDMGVIDADGNHTAYVGPYPLKHVNYKNEQWFHEAMLKGVYVSDVFMGFRNFPHIIVAVSAHEGDRNWILRATIDSDVFDSLVRTVQLGDAGDAWLVNRDGQLQTTPRFSGKVLDPSPLPMLAPCPGARVDDMDLDGSRRIVGRAWLNRAPWLLVVLEDPTEEMSPLFRTQWIVMTLLGVVMILILIGTMLSTNSTVRKLINAEREKAALDASLMQASKMAALGKLAAGVAHEVNNPLSLIQESAGWIKDLLTEEDPESIANFEEIEDAVNKIELHVDRARSVTHRMLGFARRMEPMQENVDVNDIAAQTLTFLENEALYRNIELTAEFRRDLPRVTTDTAQVQQVLLNITENAIDAVEKDGSVTLRTGYDRDAEQVFITVTDTGSGIPREDLGRIFDPFYTTKKVGEGTGLGLAIAYSIMQKLGGTILVDSTPGDGTTFDVRLPVHSAPGMANGA
ncbi:two-component system NtrC family sensor kinase [Desulfobaculum xiamenense]|uniref:histidine kinase n=1 Tax=Desulfobaculum xiamenense TaxID=995050 RepID=A0A846QGX6_9BACT|nr:PAS domain-containing sensor histidine kinase [Desulfobaculum xiamenense]NJB68066.1 two-component system NtrC family sensor kinase [Desulfobaculum xiamenense]